MGWLCFRAVAEVGCFPFILLGRKGSVIPMNYQKFRWISTVAQQLEIAAFSGSFHALSHFGKYADRYLGALQLTASIAGSIWRQ